LEETTEFNIKEELEQVKKQMSQYLEGFGLN
jgi:hypothetical protein